MPGLGHQARRQLPVQQYQFAGLVRHLDVVDAGEEFVVLVMVMDAGALSWPLGVEPEAQAQGLVAILQDGPGAGLGIVQHLIQCGDALTFQIEVLEATAKIVGADEKSAASSSLKVARIRRLISSACGNRLPWMGVLVQSLGVVCWAVMVTLL